MDRCNPPKKNKQVKLKVHNIIRWLQGIKRISRFVYSPYRQVSAVKCWNWSAGAGAGKEMRFSALMD